MPGVFAALAELQRHGYRFIMVTNQDGLGTASFPQADFDVAQNFLLEAFRSQGITFDAVLICPHRAEARCDCRKPGLRCSSLILRPMNSTGRAAR